MSKQNVEKALKKELKVINEIIDSRIIRGLSYSKEARRHKEILNSLANMKRNGAWFSRSFSLV